MLEWQKWDRWAKGRTHNASHKSSFICLRWFTDFAPSSLKRPLLRWAVFSSVYKVKFHQHFRRHLIIVLQREAYPFSHGAAHSALSSAASLESVTASALLHTCLLNLPSRQSSGCTSRAVHRTCQLCFVNGEVSVRGQSQERCCSWVVPLNPDTRLESKEWLDW